MNSKIIDLKYTFNNSILIINTIQFNIYLLQISETSYFGKNIMQ